MTAIESAPSAAAPADDAARPTSILRASGVVALCTLASRVLGLVRDALGAAHFGAGWEYGAFNLAWLLPNLFRRLFGEGGMASAFVPAFARASRERDPDAPRRLVASVAGALIVVLGGLALLGIAAAILLPPSAVAPLLGEPRAARLALRLSGIFSPYLLLVCLYALATAVLNSRGRFLLPAVAPAALNLVWIGGFGALALAAPATLEEGATFLAGFVLAGGILQLAMQLPAMRAEGLLPKPRLAPDDPAFRGVVRTMVPVVFGLSLVQVNLVVDQAVAWAFVSPGANSLIYLANRLVQFPLSMVGMAAASAAFPALAQRAAAGDLAGFRRAHDRTLGFVVFLAAAAGAGLFALAEPIVRLLFEHGRFAASDAKAAASAVALLGLGVPFFCAAQILSRALYALGDTRAPVRIAVVLVFVNFGLNLLLVGPLGVGGLALATSVCSAANVAALAFALRVRVPGTQGATLRVRFAKSAAAATACAAAAWGAWRLADGAGLAAVPAVALAVFAGALGAFAAGALLRSPEIADLREALARRRAGRGRK